MEDGFLKHFHILKVSSAPADIMRVLLGLIDVCNTRSTSTQCTLVAMLLKSYLRVLLAQ